LPVFKVGEVPPGTPCTNRNENKNETLLKPSSTGKPGPIPAGEIETNRDTTSQIETTHQTSQRQVAIGPSRNDSKWPGEDSPPAQSCNLGHGLPRDGSSSAFRSSRTACSRLRRGIDSPPVASLRILTPEIDPIGRVQVREHPAARGSNRETRSRPRGWPWRQDGWLRTPAWRADRADRGSHPPLAGSPRKVDDVGGPPRLAACWGGVDILHGAPVNAPASVGLNRRKLLHGMQLRAASSYDRWCDNTQPRVVIQTV
jgi:hypothetical protein